MAAALEKAFIAPYLEVFEQNPFDELPLPEWKGSTEDVMKELHEGIKQHGDAASVDLEGYDQHIAVQHAHILLSVVQENMSGDALIIWQLEIAHIIFGILYLGPEGYMHVQSLPSGMGLTSIIGSIFHRAYDVALEFIAKIEYIKSDDIIKIGLQITLRDFATYCTDMKEKFGQIVKMSDSHFGARWGIFLMTYVTDLDEHPYFGRPLKKFNNNISREKLSPELKRLIKKKLPIGVIDAAAWIQRCGSYGEWLPNVDKVVQYHVTNDGFSSSQIKRGYKVYLGEYKILTERKYQLTPDWFIQKLQELSVL
jgi:hypothetical protein